MVTLCQVLTVYSCGVSRRSSTKRRLGNSFLQSRKPKPAMSEIPPATELALFCHAFDSFYLLSNWPYWRRECDLNIESQLGA